MVMSPDVAVESEATKPAQNWVKIKWPDEGVV
jgi:hypothetical protein